MSLKTFDDPLSLRRCNLLSTSVCAESSFTVGVSGTFVGDCGVLGSSSRSVSLPSVWAIEWLSE